MNAEIIRTSEPFLSAEFHESVQASLESIKELLEPMIKRDKAITQALVAVLETLEGVSILDWKQLIMAERGRSDPGKRVRLIAALFNDAARLVGRWDLLWECVLDEEGE